MELVVDLKLDTPARIPALLPFLSRPTFNAPAGEAIGALGAAAVHYVPQFLKLAASNNILCMLKNIGAIRPADLSLVVPVFTSSSTSAWRETERSLFSQYVCKALETLQPSTVDLTEVFPMFERAEVPPEVQRAAKRAAQRLRIY